MIQDPKHKPTRLKGAAYRKLQLAVWERDGFTCQHCGQFTQNSPHHIVYRSQGGSDTLDNLIILCGPNEIDCHRKVHDHKITLE